MGENVLTLVFGEVLERANEQEAVRIDSWRGGVDVCAEVDAERSPVFSQRDACQALNVTSEIAQPPKRVPANNDAHTHITRLSLQVAPSKINKKSP